MKAVLAPAVLSELTQTANWFCGWEQANVQRNQTVAAMNLVRPNRGRHMARAVAAWGTLALYLVLATPFAPALTALAAALDVDHHVQIALGTGGPRVILHHERANAPQHHHGPIARALGLLAERSSGGHPDHVIQFTSGGFTEAAMSAALTGQPESYRLAPPAPDAPSLAITSAPMALAGCKPPAPPERPPGAALVATRTTVLLI